MLRDLFEGTGVMTALDHTKIEGANDPESLSVDAQAAKVAKRAADALRRSQAHVQVTFAASNLSKSTSCLVTLGSWSHHGHVRYLALP